MSTNTKTAVTVIGLGLMGAALASAFLRHGHATTIWNRSPNKGDDLVSKGAHRAATAREAVAASPVVVVCVLDYETTRAIVEPLADALEGKVLVNLTSGQPEQARAMSQWAAERGIGYLDGAIMSTPPGIGEPHTLLLYAGAPALFEAHRPLLASLGGGSTRVGDDPGRALLYDVALLGIMYSLLTGYLTSLAMIGADGVDAKTFHPYVTQWLGAVTGFLPDMGRQVDERNYSGHEATIAMQAVGMEHFIRTHENRGIDPVPVKYVRDLMHRAIAKGHGLDDFASLIEVIRPARA